MHCIRRHSLLFFVFIPLVIITACSELPPTSAVTKANIDKNDSLEIAQLFNTALSQPEEADSLISMAFKLGQSSGQLPTYHFYLSRHYIQTGKIQEADQLLDSVINTYPDVKLSYDLAKFYNLKAATSAYKHQQQTSVNYYQKALEIYEKHQDIKQKGVIEFNLANIFFSRLDYPSAYKYIHEAIESFAMVGDSTYRPIANGILAIAALKMHKDDEAKACLELAKQESEQQQNLMGQLIAIYAQAEWELVHDEAHKALQSFLKAKSFSEDNKIFQLILPIQAALLTTYNQLGQFKEATSIGQATLQIAQQLNNKEIQYSLNKNLAESFAKQGQMSQAYDHMQAAHDIFKDNTMSNNQEVIQKLLIEYETERKNNTILQQKSDLNQQRTWLMISTLLALILIILLIAYRRSNLQKRKVEKQQQIIAQAEAMADGEERERKRLAQELHDGIASNLVAIKMQLESLVPNLGSISHTLSLVKNTHVEVRKIAHNLMPIDFEQQNLNEVIEQFAKHMSNNQTKVQCFSKVQQFRLPIQKASILYRCIQELIQNAIKHAQATNVNIQILQPNLNELLFIIDDNGIGVDMELWQAKRLGIYKSEERLKNIDTTFSLDSSPQSGTTIVLNTKI